jgi:PAS domain S-box-containing protein
VCPPDRKNEPAGRRGKRDKQWLETQYASLIGQVSEYAIFTIDVNGVPISWNIGVQQVLGYTEEEFVGKTILDTLFTPEDVEAGIPQRELELAREHGSSLDDRWMVRKGGIQFFATGITTRLNDEEGRLIGYAKLMRDQTDQRLVEERLRESEEHLRMALGAADMGTWLYQVESQEIQLDEYLVHMLGLPETNHRWRIEQLVQVVHPDDRRMLFVETERALNEGSEIRSEFRLSIPNVETRWVKIQGRLVRDGDGPHVFAGACLDITTRRSTEIALQEAGRRKDEFLATLAHELRNPLAPLRNGLRILEIADDDPDLRRDTHQMMDRQVGHMVRLIDDLLDMSRISRGSIELRKEVVDLHSVIEQALETSRPAIQKAGHKLHVLLAPDAAMVEADVTRLTQVFNNLLNNASKYTEPGGTITLTLRVEGEEAITTVIDDGLGIPPQMLNEVFEMFAQVDRSLERSHTGLGIGLSIVKRLVNMHGGKVSAYSEGLGCGSRFIVQLPLADQQGMPGVHDKGEGSHLADMREHQGVYHRILVVDDNPDATTTMANIFRVLGHQVRTAANGSEAVEQAMTFKPELIFMDIGMPGMNGYEACRTIRERMPGERIVIVALTGWGQEEDRQRSREAGFDHHLVKPIDGQTVAKLLQGLERKA